MTNPMHRPGDAGIELPEPGARRIAGKFSRRRFSGIGALLLGACFLRVLPGAAAPDDTIVHFRLSPGPRLVGTRADSSGSGSVTATLQGSKLMLNGSFRGLLGVPTSAHLLMGSLPGVRGPLIADLTVSPATTGTLSGTVQLNPQQLAALRKSSLYVEIDSDKAPEGDLWGWIMVR